MEEDGSKMRSMHYAQDEISIAMPFHLGLGEGPGSTSVQCT